MPMVRRGRRRLESRIGEHGRHRIVGPRIFLVVRSSIQYMDATPSLIAPSSLMRLVLLSSGSRCRRSQRLLLQRGPDEAREFTCHGGRCFAGWFPCNEQVPVAAMQPCVGAVGDAHGPLGLTDTALPQPLTDAWHVTLVPGRLDKQATRMGVARLRDASPPPMLTAAVLAGREPEEGHQCAR